MAFLSALATILRFYAKKILNIFKICRLILANFREIVYNIPNYTLLVNFDGAI